MKKTMKGLDQGLTLMNQIKQILEFDDSSIRMYLDHSYPQWGDREKGWPMEDSIEYKVVNFMPPESDKSYSNLEQFSAQPDLKMFWNIHVQKQVLYFEEECLMMMNIAKSHTL
ncbi:MAG: hypothetical protein U0V70_11400 [Terriglobia bacterium]